jgi:acetoin:2,6-dichlorophenolindophenol oxidoreductase subunit alpha
MMSISLPNLANFDDHRLKQLFETMWTIRLFEEKVDFFFAKGMIHGTTHLCVGQEASQTGAASVLRQSDWMVATHRGHGQTIAKGTDVPAMMAELFGRRNGTNRGKGGSMHIAEMKTGNLGANGIVGGGFPIAVGAALTSKLKKDDKVTLCFAGDGATNEGSFHESLNMAAIWDLPVVFFIENNKYAMSGSIEEMTRIPQLSIRASSYGFPGITIDGNNLIEVINTTYEAVERARRGEGPTLIEAVTYRWKGHSKSDAKKYRTREEEDMWRTQRDPIANTQKRLIEAGILSEQEAIQIKEQAQARIEAAVEFALSGEVANIDDLLTHVYAD